MSDSQAITALLGQWVAGDREALDLLTPRVYAELRKLAAGYLRRERRDHTLQPTALVNQAYVRLEQKQAPSFQICPHFFAIAAHLMRQILVDHARRKQAAKRSGWQVSRGEAVHLPDGHNADLLALDESLKELEALDARRANAVESNYFGGLSVDKIAEALQVSTKTVRRDLPFSEAWLCQRMEGTPS